MADVSEDVVAGLLSRWRRQLLQLCMSSGTAVSKAVVLASEFLGHDSHDNHNSSVNAMDCTPAAVAVVMRRLLAATEAQGSRAVA